MTLSLFHPAIAAWFGKTFLEPTGAQAEAWPSITQGRHTLIAAPTGSGKTLAAFLAAIDGLVREGVAGTLTNETRVVYVSPLKALSNDIQRNLEAPLAGIREQLKAQGLPDIEIRTWVRTGDTPPGERARMSKNPPHIVVTTPESLYILLGSESGRAMLATTRSVIVDEIHAMAPNKRGAHLALSLERLAALCGGHYPERSLLRIGLSATQKPIEDVARFLVGTGPENGPAPECRIVDTGHVRKRDLAIEVPSSPLDAVMSNEVWTEIYDKVAQLIEAHRTTLIFVNTRRMAERATRQISERIGEAHIATHHGSLSKEQRFESEQRLKRGDLRALVATASLELGIDIGDVDLVIQLGSPRAIAAFLQRVGRSGHSVGGTPKGRLFPLSRDELVECTSLIDSVQRGELDRLFIPERPLDLLAQQIVAEVAAREWTEDALFARFRRAWPYRDLPRADFDAIVTMLGEGFTTRRGRRGALIHHDAVNKELRGRKGARLTALTSGGAIPDNADYRVLLEPENSFIGTVNEDFAVESLAGDVFQLGNHSYRILRVERGTVRVEDAHGQPPSIPFWLGEAPGRSDELSVSVSRLREEIAARLDRDPSGDEARRWLIAQAGVSEAVALEIVEYLSMGKQALGVLPTRDTLVFERFFDEAGGMQLVIHSPYGSRINRAWGLALRKRFCRNFNFELQAAATEDNIVLSLTQAHSFDLEEVKRYLHSNSARDVLTQALLDAPMFQTRWRWVAGASLALPRFRGGKKVPPQFARMDSEDLLASVFPDQVACAENLPGGPIEIPDHPLVVQTIKDCLTEAMDVEGFERLLRGIEAGDIKVIARDLTGPSPLALEVLSARPYAFLDDAPLEERRTQAVMSRGWLSPETAADLGRLDPEAIERVRGEAWPDPTNADELHDSLVWLSFLTDEEAKDWSGWLRELASQKRVAKLDNRLWITAERLPQFRALWPEAALTPAIEAPAAYVKDWMQEDALVEILRGRLEGLGPVAETALAQSLRGTPHPNPPPQGRRELGSSSISGSLPLDGGGWGGGGEIESDVSGALLALQAEGFAMRGRFTPGTDSDEWCDRRLLARIHRYTVKRLRAEIEPVAARDFLRFLLSWQRVAAGSRMEGPEAIEPVVAQLEGFEAPAGAWEAEMLPVRLKGYEPAWLDDLCLSGRVSWARLRPRNARPSKEEGSAPVTSRGTAPVRSTPITLLARKHAGLWASLAPSDENLRPTTGPAKSVLDFIREHGASFFDELAEGTGLLRPQVEEALAELVALGLLNSDSFGGLRALLVPQDRRRSFAGGRRRRRPSPFGMDDAGRWALARRLRPAHAAKPNEAIEHIARALLRRYGVVFWRLLEREASWLPPWRDLLRVYRTLEARGEIRGGRFVSGFSGEQFALPDAVGMLREIRRKGEDGTMISVSGADPLNLQGILTPGPKLASLTGNRLLYRDGIPIAMLAGGETQFLEQLAPGEEWAARQALLRSPAMEVELPKAEAPRDD